MATITINGVTIDPTAEADALEGASLLSANARDSDYLLVQADGPLTQAQRAKLEKAGAKILEFVPQDTYICHYTGTSLAKIRALPFVTWANTYLRGFKINPALLPGATAPGPQGLVEADAAASGTLDRTPQRVDIVLHRNARPATVRKKIAAAAGVDPDDITITGNKVRLTVAERSLPKLAEIDAVRSIERVSPKKLQNNIARDIVRVGVPLADATVLEGAGQIVAVGDTGFDKGSTTNVHPGVHGPRQEALRAGRPGKQNDPHGHGTHVAGSVLGDGNSTTHRRQGCAARRRRPGWCCSRRSRRERRTGWPARPTSQTCSSSRTRPTRRACTPTPGAISRRRRPVQLRVFRARRLRLEPPRPGDLLRRRQRGHRLGRQRHGRSQLDQAAEHGQELHHDRRDREQPADQNLSTYGSAGPGTFPQRRSRPIVSPTTPTVMVAFSSRGPTHDQRIKPDVVAPGTCILSTRSRDCARRPAGDLVERPVVLLRRRHEHGHAAGRRLRGGAARVRWSRSKRSPRRAPR